MQKKEKVSPIFFNSGKFAQMERVKMQKFRKMDRFPVYKGGRVSEMCHCYLMAFLL
jgi:hypothetical protein